MIRVKDNPVKRLLFLWLRRFLTSLEQDVIQPLGFQSSYKFMGPFKRSDHAITRPHVLRMQRSWYLDLSFLQWEGEVRHLPRILGHEVLDV